MLPSGTENNIAVVEVCGTVLALQDAGDTTLASPLPMPAVFFCTVLKEGLNLLLYQQTSLLHIQCGTSSDIQIQRVDLQQALCIPGKVSDNVQ